MTHRRTTSRFSYYEINARSQRLPNHTRETPRVYTNPKQRRQTYKACKYSALSIMASKLYWEEIKS